MTEEKDEGITPTIQLTEDALEAAKKLYEIRKDANARLAEVKQRARAEIKAINGAAEVEWAAVWRELSVAAGIDAHEEAQGKWRIDLTYLPKHNQAFLFQELPEDEEPRLAKSLH